MIAGLIVWFFYKNEINNNKTVNFKVSINKISKFYKVIIYQSLIVLSAYSSYKGIDYYSQYFYEVLNYSKEKAAVTMSNFSYLRPICALIAGLVADKIYASKSSVYLFLLMILSFLFLIFFSSNINMNFLIIINILTSMIAVFALRGIYFCYLKEKNIPSSITGISVGIISLIGFFPDVYIGPIFGIIIDTYDSTKAFNLCFCFLLLISTIGFFSSYKLFKKK